MLLGKYMQELKVWAKREIDDATSKKARFLTGGSESSRCEKHMKQIEHRAYVDRSSFQLQFKEWI